MTRTSAMLLPCIKAELNRTMAEPCLRPLRQFLIDEWSSAFPVRGFLVRVAYEVGGGTRAGVRHAAAAVELAQLSTLVVDDVIDMSQWRSGPSVVSRFGAGTGFLAGEILKSSASSLLAQTSLSRSGRGHAAMLEFESTFQDVCRGQLLDLNYERSAPISEREYLRMVGLTTGRFLEGALAVGALLSGCPRSTVSALREFGRLAGIAFQVYDDVFDLVPLPTHDKEFANDIKRCKQRLPWLHFHGVCSGAGRRLLRDLSMKKLVTDRHAHDIVKRMVKGGSIDYCIRRARRYANLARRQIPHIGSHAAILSCFMDLIEEDDAAVVARLRVRGETSL